MALAYAFALSRPQSRQSTSYRHHEYRTDQRAYRHHSWSVLEARRPRKLCRRSICLPRSSLCSNARWDQDGLSPQPQRPGLRYGSHQNNDEALLGAQRDIARALKMILVIDIENGPDVGPGYAEIVAEEQQTPLLERVFDRGGTSAARALLGLDPGLSAPTDCGGHMERQPGPTQVTSSQDSADWTYSNEDNKPSSTSTSRKCFRCWKSKNGGVAGAPLRLHQWSRSQ